MISSVFLKMPVDSTVSFYAKHLHDWFDHLFFTFRSMTISLIYHGSFKWTTIRKMFHFYKWIQQQKQTCAIVSSNLWLLSMVKVRHIVHRYRLDPIVNIRTKKINWFLNKQISNENIHRRILIKTQNAFITNKPYRFHPRPTIWFTTNNSLHLNEQRLYRMATINRVLCCGKMTRRYQKRFQRFLCRINVHQHRKCSKMKIFSAMTSIIC